MSEYDFSEGASSFMHDSMWSQAVRSNGVIVFLYFILIWTTVRVLCVI